ncbi:FkbM family methyltransferase [Algibacter sp. L3A6]|uniref:FkbM family methyltransferase n=1 Tax=Algibacter sp. L3A6 TaxID=2686366 RepID=UPI00131DCB78|nr:FkbM family methyltransferase [Algibacter sp. L3A6]
MKKTIYKFINRLGYKIEKKRPKEYFFPELKKYNITENFELLFNSKIFVKSLDAIYSNFALQSHKDGFLVSFLDFNIYVESIEEFLILNEVFVTKDYNFISNHKTTVIDIGANIGISSLYFSTLDCVDKIYAFEPIIDTFNQAQYNLELNKTRHKVIAIKNIGLGKSNRTETVLFNKSSKGNTGVRGLLSPTYASNAQNEIRALKIVETSKEIEKIITTSVGQKIMIKMDCEGAEYEIFENLSESNLLDKIDVLIIEWHDKGAKSIENTLLKFGFNVFSRDLGPISGIITASK